MTISETSLDLAVSHGHITASQADKLREIEATANAVHADSPDDEKLRFITGFADIFVTIGIGLFLGASGYFLYQAFGFSGLWIGISALAWLLAEFFTRRRRLALPSIVLLVTFVVTSFYALMFLLEPKTIPANAWFMLTVLNMYTTLKGVALPAVLTAGLAAVHYWRFRVPITIAACAAVLAMASLNLLAGFAQSIPHIRTIASFVLGLAIFAFAMRFDMSDPKRVTRRTDIAFWLHLLAAPMIVHSLVLSILGFSGQGKLNEIGNLQAIAILSIFFFLGIIAIIIDRRAILVSSLTYAGLAFGSLIKQSGIATNSVPATMLALGTFVLLLSAFWQPLRRASLRLIPSGLRRNLPHPIVSGS